MPLTWELGKIKDWQTVCRQPAFNDDGSPALGDDGEQLTRIGGLTEAFIWATMATGLDSGWELTEEFAPEFYARIKFLEALDGSLVWKAGEEYLITPEDVASHIGPQTNAGSLTRTEFVKRLQRRLDDRKADYRRTMERAAEGATV